MEYIITFKNTSSAIKAEQCLLAKNLGVTVLPLPSKISSGCGICLKVKEAELKAALNTLTKENIGEIGLYSRIMEDGKYFYEKIGG